MTQIKGFSLLSTSTLSSRQHRPHLVNAIAMAELVTNKTKVLLEEFRCLLLVLRILCLSDSDHASIMPSDDKGDSDALEWRMHTNRDSAARARMLLANIAAILVRDHEILAVATAGSSVTTLDIIITINPDHSDNYFRESDDKWLCVLIPPGTSHISSILSDAWCGIL
jgi:hypothetical protein